MFWRFGGYANISTLDSILDKPDVTVEELLDESDLIQELKQQNSKLIEFLRDDNVLQRLLQYVTAPKQDEDQESLELEEEETSSGNPLNSFFSKSRRSRSKSVGKQEGEEETKEEKQRMKYAYVACEILSCDVWSISEALLENRDALHKFWDYLKQDAPLDPVQAGHFQKVNDSLFDKKTEEMIEVLKSIDGVVPSMLKHVDCPTMMDLLLKIISMERSEGGQGIVDWLQTQNLIPLLLSNLSPDREAATQTSAGDFLKAIITISANATAQDTNVIGPNELTRQLVSEECVQTLITDMLRGGNTLTVGVGIIIEVIRKNNSDYDLDNQIGPVPRSSDPIYLGTLLRCFAKNVTNFMDLIGNASQKKELKVAFGEKIEPLGFDRFKTCELMAELLHCSNMALLNERGSEAEVRRRDAERERLKAEGKLSLTKDSSEANNEDDFGTSVDSSGFHHARAPSLSNESPEEIKRPLEVSNGTEDEFENVTASEANVDDMKDSFDDKEQFVGEPLERSPRARPRSPVKNPDDDLTVPPLSPKKAHARSKSDSKAKLEASEVKDADSPTSAGLTDRLNNVGLDKDTVMEDSPSKDVSEDTGDQPLALAPDMDDDKPAPLFSGKRPLSPTKIDPPQATGGSSRTDDQTHDASVETNPTGESQTASVTQGSENDDVPPYELDIDGQPVVGDLLKMKFVEHHVVPTILDFFFRFPWNNFLHNVVYDVVQQVFNGQMNRGFNRSLAIDLFETGRITDRIVEGQQASDKAQKENNMRLGYMGHLTLIAEEVVKFTERHPPECLSQSVLDKVMAKQWVEYVEQTLAETRERDNAILGGVRPDMSVGPRQAVLNAVNAAQGYGGSSAAGSAMSGLSTGTGAMGLDTAELTSATGNTSSGGYLFSGSSLLSGFNHGSSDEEDEEMEGGEQGGDSEFPRPSPIEDQDQVGELSFEDVDMDYR
ncbi:NADPH-dependent diflavin oxidoreductase 1 [Venturia nashicola]|uniref:NADPH-dependent diflavin oxidoreductase 1 n=1 Tax=Venturia nashicola TaxID=86259 RepID=A0A4Z1NVK8_9PEZI|nr:NADPH-dependent diflavin oxidoreductase 1 [Venturia nashicola]